MIPRKDELYIHNKSQNKYKVVGIGKHSETKEDVVVLAPQYDSEVTFWLRPLSLFSEEVDINGVKMPRFSKTT